MSLRIHGLCALDNFTNQENKGQRCELPILLTSRFNNLFVTILNQMLTPRQEILLSLCRPLAKAAKQLVALSFRKLLLSVVIRLLAVLALHPLALQVLENYVVFSYSSVNTAGNLLRMTFHGTL